MEYYKEAVTNTVLEVILEADKYINNIEIAGFTKLPEEEVNNAISRIKIYNELFLDLQYQGLNDEVVYSRVREWVRDDVRNFLYNGGFITIQKELGELQEPGEKE